MKTPEQEQLMKDCQHTIASLAGDDLPTLKKGRKIIVSIFSHIEDTAKRLPNGDTEHGDIEFMRHCNGLVLKAVDDRIAELSGDNS